MEVKRDFCTLPLKRLGLFFKEVSSAHQGCIIWSKYCKNNTNIKYYYNFKM